MADYTCFVNQTITVGTTSVGDPDLCTGFDETPIRWTAPSTPGLYSVPVPIVTYHLVWLRGPGPDPWDGSDVCRSRASTKFYSVQVNAAGPTITSTGMQACPGQTFVITGDFFGPNGQADIVSPATFLPIVSGPTSNDGGTTWTMTVRLPGSFSTTHTTYQLTVTDGAGHVSAPAAFTVPTGCAVIQPPGVSLTISSSLNPCTTANTVSLHAVNQNNADVTTQTAFSGSGVTGTSFHSATPGTYVVFGIYQGVTSSYSQVVNAVAGPSTTQLLAGYAVPTFFVPYASTPTVTAVITSQINIYFADGRHGFIPASRTAAVSLAPGQAWIAQYTEVVDVNMVPILPQDSQQLSPQFVHYVQSIDDDQAFYNTGQLTANLDGTFTRTYSVLLGICDPIEGKFQSLWDIWSYNGVDNDILPQAPCGHGMFLSAKGDISVEEYAKKKLAKHRATDVSLDTERAAAMWSGAADYSKGVLRITTPFKLFILDYVSNAFGVAYTSSEKAIKMKTGQTLVAVPTSSHSWDLQAISANDKLFESSHTYVLGVVTDEKFHSNWPFIQASNSTAKLVTSNVPASMQKIIQRMKDSKR